MILKAFLLGWLTGLTVMVFWGAFKLGQHEEALNHDKEDSNNE